MNKNYYTIEAEFPSSIGENITKLCNEGIFLSSTLMLREELANFGIYIRNKSEIPYTLRWNDTSKSENEVIEYIEKKYKLKLIEITATVDFSKFLQKFCDGKVDNMKRIPLDEEVLGSNIEIEDIYKKIKRYLANIKSTSSKNELIITDPWFLQINELQMNVVVDILRTLGITNLKLYTEKRGNKDDFEKKLKEFEIEVKIYKTNIFHDRFWIIGEKGIVIGTSFNSIGARIALLDYISNEDVKTIYEYINDKEDSMTVFE